MIGARTLHPETNKCEKWFRTATDEGLGQLRHCRHHPLDHWNHYNQHNSNSNKIN